MRTAKAPGLLETILIGLYLYPKRAKKGTTMAQICKDPPTKVQYGQSFINIEGCSQSIGPNKKQVAIQEERPTSNACIRSRARTMRNHHESEGLRVTGDATRAKTRNSRWNCRKFQSGSRHQPPLLLLFHSQSHLWVGTWTIHPSASSPSN